MRQRLNKLGSRDDLWRLKEHCIYDFRRLTLGRNDVVVVVTTVQSGAVENLVEYDSKAVDVSFLTCLDVSCSCTSTL